MGRPWDFEERAWARECFAAGDSLADIAVECDRCLLEVAHELGLYGWRPRSLRWQQYDPSRPCRWIGGMLREVAVARYLAGESQKSLAAIAQVSTTSMHKLCASARAERKITRRAA